MSRRSPLPAPKQLTLRQHPFLRLLACSALLTLVLCALALLAPTSVYAQDLQAIVEATEPGGSVLAQYVPTAITSHNGLPQNSVRAIAQSADGYVWLATEEGLVRYDGNYTRVFDRSTDPALRDNFIRSIAAAPDGSVWVGTRSGINRYAHGSFVTHIPTDEQMLRLVFCDNLGKVWVGTDQGLYTVQEDSTDLIDFPGIPKTVSIRQLATGPDGTMWAATSTGLWSINHGQARHHDETEGLPDLNLKTLTVTDDGSIWVSTLTDLVHWNHRVLKRLSIDTLAPHARVTSLLVDGSGKLWIGTERDGIAILQGNQLFHYRAKDGLPSDAVEVLHKDRDDNLWVGTNGAGAVRFHAGLFTTYGAREGLSESMVFLARTARDGSVWTATMHQQLNHLLPGGQVEVIGAKEGLPPGIIYSMFEDADGSLWAGSDRGDLIHVIGRHASVFHNPAHAQDKLRAILRGPDGDLFLLYPTQFGLVRFRDGKFLVEPRNIPGLPGSANRAPDGSLWIGTDKGGVSHWNNGLLEVFGPRQGLTTELIETLIVDREGTVWVGSSPDGLMRIRNGQVTRYTPENGLFDYTVGTITDDLHGWLWMTSNKGLYKVSKQDLNNVAEGRAARIHSIVYGVPDGMRTAECNYDTSPSASLAPNGRLWFASGEGLVSILPSASAMRSSRPEAVIEGVVVDGARTAGSGLRKTSAGAHDVEFDFTAPDFAAPERLLFRYRLEGFDHDWNDIGNRRQAFYTQLPPGSYKLLVQANDGSGWPSDSASMQLLVVPHFWQTTWFCGLAVVLLLLCGWGGYEARNGALRRSQRILQEQVVARTAELQQAMRNAEAAQHELQELATRDSMTLLWNRRHIFDMLSSEANRTDREKRSLCVLMLDVDHFKQVNDTRGHLAGDRVLQAVANVLTDQTRPYDCAGRYGGEEFLVILCNCTLENGLKRADMIRRAIASACVEWNGQDIAVTASFGVALHTPGQNIETVLDDADRALYRAKQAGRNRVCSPPPIDMPTLETVAAGCLRERSTERLAALRAAPLRSAWDAS